MDEFLDKRLNAIELKLERLLNLAEGNALKRAQSMAKKKRLKPPPLTPEQLDQSRRLFSALFERWLNGDEIQVHDELESQEVEDLRQFADANNLNVTSKMSRARMLELVAARFREKRQLHKPPVERG